MKGKPLLYELKVTVKMTESNEQGTIIGRAEYIDHVNGYLVRFRAGDGCQTEKWFDETAIEAA